MMTCRRSGVTGMGPTISARGGVPVDLLPAFDDFARVPRAPRRSWRAHMHVASTNAPRAGAAERRRRASQTPAPSTIHSQGSMMNSDVAVEPVPAERHQQADAVVVQQVQQDVQDHTDVRQHQQPSRAGRRIAAGLAAALGDRRAEQASRASSSDRQQRSAPECRASSRGGTRPTACWSRTPARRCPADSPRSSASRCRMRVRRFRPASPSAAPTSV